MILGKKREFSHTLLWHFLMVGLVAFLHSLHVVTNPILSHLSPYFVEEVRALNINVLILLPELSSCKVAVVTFITTILKSTVS